jgi:cold shock CspA family protein
MQGKVLWFDDNKGYGFLGTSETTLEVPSDIFFHWSAIQVEDNFKTLYYGQPVEFELNKNETIGKWEAINVKPLPFVNEETGKPLLLVSLSTTGQDYTMEKFQMELGVKEKRGLKYLWIDPQGDILAISRAPSEFKEEELKFITNELWKSPGIKLINTRKHLKYDLLRV